MVTTAATSKETLAVLKQRVTQLEKDFSQHLKTNDTRFASIDHSLKTVIELNVHAAKAHEAIERAFLRIEALDRSVHGSGQQPGLVGFMQKADSKLENHSWALRLIAATFATQLGALGIWAFTVVARVGH